MSGRRVFELAIVAAVLAGCSRAPKISDTGYTGTWSRGNDRVSSIIAIVNDRGTYRFRWTLTSDDEKWSVKCDWEGNCEEMEYGAKIATYAFECHMDPEKRHLMVKMSRTGTPKSPDTHTDLDELVLEPGSGGKVLWSYTIQRDATSFELAKGPSRSFNKLSDDVDDPPSTSKR